MAIVNANISLDRDKGVSNKWEDLVFGQVVRNDRENSSMLYLPSAEGETRLGGKFELGSDEFDSPLNVRYTLLSSRINRFEFWYSDNRSRLRVFDLPQERGVNEYVHELVPKTSDGEWVWKFLLSFDDNISGSRNSDTLYGYDGDDTIYGRNASDLVDGGAGNDKIYGGYGDDTLLGGVGQDYIGGGGDNDYIHGQHGRDEMHGGGGNDTIRGGHGHDEIFASNGSDWIWGGIGKNTRCRFE